MLKALTKKNFLIIFSLLIINSAAASVDTRYSIVIDAGSSGSRLHIFQETSQGADQLADIKDLTPQNSTVQPGISSYVKNPQDAGPTLKPLFDKAQQVLQSIGVDESQAEVKLYGTAGMRLLPPELQQNIYQAISEYLSSHYKFKNLSIKTIPGHMEAIYGWFAVNYLENNFLPGKNITMGSLDLGGASTQTAFVSRYAPIMKDTYSFTLAGKTYRVFAQSFLGLGQDQARLNIASLSCYPTGYGVPNLGVGQFNYAGCRAAVDNYIAQYKMPYIVPPVEPAMTYIAYSGYYYTANFFNVKTPAELANTVQQICVKSWDELQQQFPKVPAKYLANYCFNGIYAHELLTAGYRFPENTQQIEFDNQIASRDIDWSIGVAVADSTKPLG